MYQRRNIGQYRIGNKQIDDMSNRPANQQETDALCQPLTY